MRYKLLTLGLLLFIAAPDWAGPIADQFRSGYEGIRWGLSISDLVGMLPEGEHHFSTASGERVYIVRNNDPLFGIPRAGNTVQYHFGKNGGVEYIAVGIPYDRYQQLLGALTSQFGAYATSGQVGTATEFRWKVDECVLMAVRVSRDPRYGIAEFWLDHTPLTTGKPTVKCGAS